MAGTHWSSTSSYGQERSSLLEMQKERCWKPSPPANRFTIDIDGLPAFGQAIYGLQELNARILNELIEKIVVHEKERSEDGTVTQQVEIHYKFIGYIDPTTMLNEILSSAGSLDKTNPVAIIL